MSTLLQSEEVQSGQLWIVATPLGNVYDLSPRARDVLQSVDVVLAEDTRRAGLLCQRCGLSVSQFMSFHEHNEMQRVPQVIELLAQGKTAALISDAGTPLMADPGYRLVRACREAGVCVRPAPGACAPITALMAAGIAPQPFMFFGFLPRDSGAQQKLFAPFAQMACTLVFFERKDRLAHTLRTAHALLGSREVVIARELTKTHEEFITGRLEAHETLAADLRGEITVIIGPPEGDGGRTEEADVLLLLQEEMAKGGKPRAVAQRVQGQIHGWTVKDVYLLSTRQPSNATALRIPCR